jgi:hypothetical protein
MTQAQPTTIYKNYLQATIPTTPYLRLFIEHIENLEPGEPLSVSRPSFVAMQLNLLLTRPSVFRALADRNDVQIPSEYTDCMPFVVLEWMMQQKCIFICNRSVVAFNDVVRQFFYENLLQRTRARENRGREKKDVIGDYLSEMGIHEDILSFDTAKKALFRLETAKQLVKKK